MTEPYTTLNAIRAFRPCSDGWWKLLAHLGKTAADDEPLSLLTILNSNGISDALWCLRALGPEWASPVRELARDLVANARLSTARLVVMMDDETNAGIAAEAAVRAAARDAAETAARNAADEAASRFIGKDATKAAWDAGWQVGWAATFAHCEEIVRAWCQNNTDSSTAATLIEPGRAK